MSSTNQSVSHPSAVVNSAHVLKDGTLPQSTTELFARLDELGIVHSTLTHRPVFTVAQAKTLRGKLPGAHSKNLFLRNKKGRMWLITCEESRSINLMQTAEWLGAKRFSFASPERLMGYLGVIPGAVTPFAVINDTSNQVQTVLDAKLLEEDLLNFHPLDNTMTTQLASQDLITFLQAQNHGPVIVDFDCGAVLNGTPANPA